MDPSAKTSSCNGNRESRGKVKSFQQLMGEEGEEAFWISMGISSPNWSTIFPKKNMALEYMEMLLNCRICKMSSLGW